MGRRRTKRPDSKVSGCLVLDKPAGCTSHDVVDQARRALGTRKVGHAGTLDPDATGVLVLGVGAGTKLLEFVVGTDKTYEGTIQFGSETSTLDAAGEVTATYDMSFGEAQAQKAKEQFLGDIEQIPPMVSAVKVNGQRLHELARQGKEVERKARAVTISRFDLFTTDDPLVYSFVVDCSSGTYIRTLAADLGTALGGGAHLKTLRRTRVGAFQIEKAQKLDPENPDTLALQPLEELLTGVPLLEVDDTVAQQVRNGRSLGQAPGEGLVGIKDQHGKLLAVYSAQDGHLKPAKIMPQ